MRIKICGITRKQDLELAIELGATEVGMVFAKSPRQISLKEAQLIMQDISKKYQTVGVFANEDLGTILDHVDQIGLDAVQLHGTELPQDVAFLKGERPRLKIYKAINVADHFFSVNPEEYDLCDALIFDSYGSHFEPNKRKTIDVHSRILNHYLRERKFKITFYLAGGLRVDNIFPLLEHYQPDGIDLSSGVEQTPGIKDDILMRTFFEQLREGEAK
jgi:phosphoribosylanthranilate isomerase